MTSGFMPPPSHIKQFAGGSYATFEEVPLSSAQDVFLMSAFSYAAFLEDKFFNLLMLNCPAGFWGESNRIIPSLCDLCIPHNPTTHTLK
mmetsp:Transcript_129776/g.224330  ORF Transcript_129776/g.224330 Transcript_129776/m.224330 type:complete len:89 (+) Transcript_129776:921-1187(+)